MCLRTTNYFFPVNTQSTDNEPTPNKGKKHKSTTINNQNKKELPCPGEWSAVTYLLDICQALHTSKEYKCKVENVTCASMYVIDSGLRPACWISQLCPPLRSTTGCPLQFHPSRALKGGSLHLTEVFSTNHNRDTLSQPQLLPRYSSRARAKNTAPMKHPSVHRPRSTSFAFPSLRPLMPMRPIPLQQADISTRRLSRYNSTPGAPDPIHHKQPRTSPSFHGSTRQHTRRRANHAAGAPITWEAWTAAARNAPLRSPPPSPPHRWPSSPSARAEKRRRPFGRPGAGT